MFNKSKAFFQNLLQTNARLAYFLIVALFIFSAGFLAFMISYITAPGLVRADSNQTAQTQSQKKSIIELHIAADGLVFLQGTKVVSISGHNIIVSTAWNNLNFTWLIQTNESYYGPRHFGTSFYDGSGKVISLADLKPGDIISVSGMMETSYTEPVVKADVIRTSN